MITLVRSACQTVALGLVTFFLSDAPAAQTPPNSPRVEFDVASVKRVDPPAPAHAVGLNITPGRLTIEAGTLRQILGLAYEIQRVRVIGGPPWIDSDQYTITATLDPPNAPRQQVRTMLQTLLQDRFNVTFHRETKEVSGYRLVKIKDVGFKLADNSETAAVAVERGKLSFANQRLGGLVNYLANILDSPVVDRTGLNGSYDFSFETVTAAGESVSPFTALQEQLGLKLEPQKTPMDVVIVDRADRPTAN